MVLIMPWRGVIIHVAIKYALGGGGGGGGGHKSCLGGSLNPCIGGGGGE